MQQPKKEASTATPVHHIMEAIAPETYKDFKNLVFSKHNPHYQELFYLSTETMNTQASVILSQAQTILCLVKQLYEKPVSKLSIVR